MKLDVTYHAKLRTVRSLSDSQQLARRFQLIMQCFMKNILGGLALTYGGIIRLFSKHSCVRHVGNTFLVPEIYSFGFNLSFHVINEWCQQQRLCYLGANGKFLFSFNIFLFGSARMTG